VDAFKKVSSILLGGVMGALIGWGTLPAAEYLEHYRMEDIGGYLYSNMVAPLIGFIIFLTAWFFLPRVRQPWKRILLALFICLFVSGFTHWVLIFTGVLNGNFGYFVK